MATGRWKRIKAALDNHPITYWVGVFLLGFGVALGPVVYFMNQNNDSNLAAKDDEIRELDQEYDSNLAAKDDEIRNLERRASSIELVAGDGTTTLDVSTLLVDKDELASVDRDLLPIEGSSVFVLDLSEDPLWRYEVTDELQIAIDQGIDFDAIGFDPSGLEDFELHAWTKGQPVEICGTTVDGEASDLSTIRACTPLWTRIFAQRFSYDEIAADEYVPATQIEEDAIGFFFANQLTIAMLSGRAQLLAVDRSDEALYAKLLLTFDPEGLDIEPGELTVNGVPTAVYYYVIDLAVFDTGSHVVFVKATVPTGDLRVQERADVESFIGNLRMVKD